MKICDICRRPIKAETKGGLCVTHHNEARTVNRLLNEARIVTMLSAGLPVAQVARELGLSDYTVRRCAENNMPPRVRTRRMADILAAAAYHANVTVADIKGPSRKRPIVMIRHAVCLIGAECYHSQPQIARAVCRKDHTTVLSSIRRARDLEASRPDYADFLDAVRTKPIEEAPTETTPPETVPNERKLLVCRPIAPPAISYKPSIKPRNDFSSQGEEQDDSHRFHADIGKGSQTLLAALRAAA
ncbi:hypothetical protein GCM10011349_20180 [Novosphingobium indicum]|uniref:Chromosomal replication initiator DnaA C-terminal domain-containing protein n=1 Tax=Novosphingobium indicum TaxID=462949 RepID=A0ABQ2JK48_9SPHN|nr:helix-turn-helix domain-containing protein [Novosphingobium indicum]GGN49500.1 hypothetical protein GCM10011349_20180 [Novosphingobium indicum]